MMTNDFVIDAPAKINLHLRVLGKRNDGFHNLESIFAALDFGDTLHVSLLDDDEARSQGKCEIVMDGNVPPGKNLISKAVSLFRQYTGFTKSMLINVEKRIPFGAGLGGGSSDAASTLIALNVLGKCGLKHEELHQLALKLGSDVPFFLDALNGAKAAFVSGRGEHIEPIQISENLCFVLVNPGFSVSTAAAFTLLDKSRQLDEQKSYVADSALSKQQLIDFLSANPATWQYQNDFLPAFLSDSYKNEDEKNAYRKIFTMFQETGASFSGLSGSGSTCFGVFLNQESAENAVKRFQDTDFFIKMTFPLARRAFRY
jgi:4-diphosphocytidyl-2-C-methyl-D-erythritol kinase